MKVLLLNSGGIDSLAACIVLNEQNYEVHSLHVEFNYPNAEESKNAAEIIANEYCLSHKVIKVDMDIRISNKINKGFPKKHLPIAFQQTFLYTLAESYAITNNFEGIANGLKYSESVTDLHDNLLLQALAENKLGSKPVAIIKPLNFLEKHYEVFNIIKDNPLAIKTVSCHSNPACGECFKCIERKNVFNKE